MCLVWCEGLEAAGQQDITEPKETEIGAQTVMVQHKGLDTSLLGQRSHLHEKPFKSDLEKITFQFFKS